MSNVEEKTTSLPSISQSESLKILSEAIWKRSYSIPHVIDNLPLTNADRDVLIALFKLEDEFLFKSHGHWERWFFATMALITKYARRSESTVRRSRRRLMYMGLILYRLGQGQTKKATEYQIQVDPFYLADKAMGVIEAEHKSNGQ